MKSRGKNCIYGERQKQRKASSCTTSSFKLPLPAGVKIKHAEIQRGVRQWSDRLLTSLLKLVLITGVLFVSFS